MECIAVIPARSGSKSIKDKNLAELGSYPLIAYSIAAAKLANQIDRVIVSTDSQKYADIAKKFGAEVPFLRPETISSDKSTDFEFMKHTIEYLGSNENKKFEYLIHLRPTTPLRDPSELDNAIKLIKSRKDATSLRSGHLSHESPFKWFQMNSDGFFTSLNSDDMDLDKYNEPRQNFPEVFIPNGYIDIVRHSHIKERQVLHGNKVLGFRTPHCVEIDSPEELDLLRYQLKHEGTPLINYLQRIN